ncbi:hypothetical protein [Companilactobacillus hulinensis]|uniref:hypothetical protein n=1 Tax=Companilactobacillus hulinensis TaxID=2486007 RepID=UPI001CDB99A6|nr:hypothetical protein [Companilactobacillus hulinensis]
MKILNKNILREFKFSIARFISISILLALGVFILIGLKVTGNDMRQTANDYYSIHNMADAEIRSNANISEVDQKKLKKLDHLKAIEFTNSTDGLISGSNTSIRIQAETTKLSTNQLISGHLPKNNHEITLNNRDKGKYEIGSYITLKNKSGDATSELKNNKYKVVGFITSSDYLLKQNLGTTTVGTGQIDTYGVVSKSAFKSNNPTVALISYNNLKGSSYSDSYEKQVEKNISQSEPTIKRMVQDRKKESYSLLIKR